MRRTFRIINALVWIGIWAGVVFWTETWGHWVPMFFQAMLPLMLGGYIHLVLRRGGTTGGTPG
jgi:hypothetical protein